MKKLLLSLILAAVALPLALHAIDGNPTWNTPQGPYIGKTGGVVSDDGAILIGGGTSAYTHGMTSGFWANAVVNLTLGQPVVYVATGVSGTTTLGDPAFAGIALTTTAASSLVPIGTNGNIRLTIGNTVAVGGKVVTSATALNVTPVAALTEANLTGLSNTAIVGVALQAVTFVTYTARTAMVHIYAH